MISSVKNDLKSYLFVFCFFTLLGGVHSNRPLWKMPISVKKWTLYLPCELVTPILAMYQEKWNSTCSVGKCVQFISLVMNSICLSYWLNTVCLVYAKTISLEEKQGIYVLLNLSSELKPSILIFFLPTMKYTTSILIESCPHHEKIRKPNVK